jgi:ketosteroid isomerase-like protein
LFVVLLSCAAISNSSAKAQSADHADGRDADRAAIRAHVDTIFQAYINKDAKTIRATHSDDWAGYFLGSRMMTRGIDAYMQVANSSISNKSGGMTGYKFDEFNVVFHGDVALVFYVAEVTGKGGENTYTDMYRSLDVYEKKGRNWIQVASNLARHPTEVENRQTKYTPAFGQTRRQILDAREEVWRAWFANDREKLEKMIPEEAIAVEAGNSEWQNRSSILDGAKRFADGGAKLVRLEFPRTDIQIYGSTIILYTSYLFETERAGKKSTNTGSGVETFVVRDGRLVNVGWLLAAEK